MAFTNAQLTEPDLPNIDHVEFRSVDSRYPYIAAAIAAIYAVMTIVALVAVRITTNPNGPIFLPPSLPPWLPTGIVALGLVSLVILTIYCYFRAKSHQYAVRTHDVVQKHGVFRQSEIVQPLVRLQHVEIVRGPIDKWAGLAKLKLFSAGAMRETFTIPGLPLRTAARIRRYALSVQRAQD